MISRDLLDIRLVNIRRGTQISLNGTSTEEIVHDNFNPIKYEFLAKDARRQ